VMALGGWLPAACRGVYFVPDGFSRRPVGTRTAIWRQKFAERVAVLATRSQYEIDWFYKACQEEHPPYCAELILWTSRTGD
jgi:phosphoserine phosphatase